MRPPRPYIGIGVIIGVGIGVGIGMIIDVWSLDFGRWILTIVLAIALTIGLTLANNVKM